MKMLYIGPLWYGSTCLQRMQAIKDLGNKVDPIDTEPEGVRNKQKRFLYRVKRKLFGPSDLAEANQQILQLVEKKNFDIVWIDKGLTIKIKTLRKIKNRIPKAMLVSYSPDNMCVRHNQSRDYLASLPYCDIHFTTKSCNVPGLLKIGAKRVEFIWCGFDPYIHHPVSITEEERKYYGGLVGFIGDYEKEREELMKYLAENGIQIRVYGPNWRRKSWIKHPNMKIEGKPLWGKEYTKAICSFDINLCFLRKINRDLHTTRSIEIPACGAFILAERTNEHLELFEEGKEAEFFGSKEELLEKVRYYLTHKEDKNRIAAAGRKRCLESGYSNHERIKKIFQIIQNLQIIKART